MKTSKWFSAAKVALALIVPVLAGQARAEDGRWHNVKPLQSGDVSVFVDFQTRLTGNPEGPGYPRNYAFEATPLWINVKRSGLKPWDNVRVMVINFTEYRNRYGSQYRQQIDEAYLQFAEDGRFTGQMKPLVIRAGTNDTINQTTTDAQRQEVVVWVNGAIYKDPSTGQNLSFNIRDYAWHY